MTSLQGNPVSNGIGVGPVIIYEPFSWETSQGEISPDETEDMVLRYQQAKQKAKKELERMIEAFSTTDPEKGKIFTAHLDVLFDEVMEEEILGLIQDDLTPPDRAVDEIYGAYIHLLEKTKDPLIRERAADLRDVRSRLLRCWAGKEEKNLSSLPKPVVVVAKDLFPSDTATLDREKVLAIVTEVGGATSHSAIIARSFEIPALLGVAGITERLQEDQTVIVDAVEGRLYCDPTPQEIEQYSRRREEYLLHMSQVKKYLNVEPVTPDGRRIEVELNIACATPQELAGAAYTDGVGLFRTEFLYMGRDRLPTEEEQFQVYRKVLEAFQGRPVTLRTLDIGGDKKLDCLALPKEENPFLGNRALRLCLSHPQMFKTQLRAALRASVHGNLWMMFPMVSSMEDIHQAKAAVQEAKNELEMEGIPYSEDMKLGVMIEIPAIALMADQIAKEVDFASIGSNDLCQYLTATDRMNPAVAEYYRSFHPAMFRLIGYAAQPFLSEGKEIGVCGEMGGDPLSAAVLIGLGITRLSMGASSVPHIKKLITGLSYERAKEIAQKVQHTALAQDVRRLLQEELQQLL